MYVNDRQFRNYGYCHLGVGVIKPPNFLVMVLLARLIKSHFPIVDILLQVRLIEVTPFIAFPLLGLQWCFITL